MTREERLKYCSVCKNRSFNPSFGIVCGLTNDLPNFEDNCPDFSEDIKEQEIQQTSEYAKKAETKGQINKGRYALIIIAILYIIAGFVEGLIMVGHELLFGVIDWLIAGVFIGLGILSYKKASLAFILGLSFYLLITVLIFALDPGTIFKGIIWKILIIYYLIYGIKTAKAEEAKSNEYKKDSLDVLDDFEI